MAINFPTSLDNFTNPSSGNTLDSPSHSLQHSDINDAVEAMQRKVGVGTAVAGSASAGQVLTISAAGTSTWSTPTPAGLVLLKTYTPTNVGSLSFDAGTFTSTYKNYVVKGFLRNTTTTSIVTIRYRAAGTDATGADYSYQELFVGSTSVVGTRGTGQTSHVVFVLGNTWDANFELNLYRPQETAVSSFNAFNFRSDAVSLMPTGGYHNQAVSYDSLSFINSSSNFTGQIQVFGVSQ